MNAQHQFFSQPGQSTTWGVPTNWGTGFTWGTPSHWGGPSQNWGPSTWGTPSHWGGLPSWNPGASSGWGTTAWNPLSGHGYAPTTPLNTNLEGFWSSWPTSPWGAWPVDLSCTTGTPFNAQQTVPWSHSSHTNFGGAAFVTPAGWQSVSVKAGQGNSPFGQACTQGIANAWVRYVATDSETTIECFVPGWNTENTEITIIGNEIRVRPSGNGQKDYDSQWYLGLTLPLYCDGTQTQAQAHGDMLRLVCPTRKEVVSHIKKIKPVRAK